MKGKDVIIFLLGAITGAVGMYFYRNKKVENQINKAFADNTNNSNEQEVVKVTLSEDEAKNFIDMDPQPKPTKEDLEKYSQVLKKVDYTKAAVSEKVKTMTDDIEEKTEELIEKAQEIVGKPESKKTSSKKAKVPKKVTQDEFDATHPSKRATLIFYADGVLADEADDTVYDPVETMGATNLKNFKSTYDPIYIFNYANNFIYEIVHDNRQYSDVVGGGNNG